MTAIVALFLLGLLVHIYMLVEGCKVIYLKEDRQDEDAQNDLHVRLIIAIVISFVIFLVGTGLFDY